MKEIYVSNKQLKKYNECDNSILPERLMGIKEGDVLVIRNKEELKSEGLDETNPVYCLSGISFIVSKHTICAIEEQSGIVAQEKIAAQFVVERRLVERLKKNGYTGKELEYNSLIDVNLSHLTKR